MKEIEVRIIDIDINDIRKKLSKINAIKVKEENQINNIYDFPDKKLIKGKGYARVRTIEDNINGVTKHYLTVKKLVSQDKYKVMDEYETEIENSSVGKNILTSLGLQLVQSIKKCRESYKYKNSLIEIDVNDKSFCPFPYIEIETESDSELSEIVHYLGYNISDTTSKTIYEILNDKRAAGDL